MAKHYIATCTNVEAPTKLFTPGKEYAGRQYGDTLAAEFTNDLGNAFILVAGNRDGRTCNSDVFSLGTGHDGFPRHFVCYATFDIREVPCPAPAA